MSRTIDRSFVAFLSFFVVLSHGWLQQKNLGPRLLPTLSIWDLISVYRPGELNNVPYRPILIADISKGSVRFYKLIGGSRLMFSDESSKFTFYSHDRGSGSGCC